ncbi:MAG: 16S rRNA (uracil(1498)-N(3))-methyltransferase [Solobacterium sp.]|nr:16S rRNA (uracil(1498)-N(3))-methyltransferase [Solobacterium sp.]
MYQFFLDEDIQIGQRITLSKAQEHHAKDVLRLNKEIVRLVANEKGYFGVAENTKEGFFITIQEEDTQEKELPVEVTLLFALIRKEKFEWVLQKATELGVKQIVPIVSKYCVVQPKKDKEAKQIERWQAIVEAASSQCKRNWIPTVHPVCELKDCQKYLSDLNLMAYEKENESLPLSKRLEKKNITILIGPEGGFSKEEVEACTKLGFASCSLGARILRAETAAIYMMSVINDWMMGNE